MRGRVGASEKGEEEKRDPREEDELGPNAAQIAF
jgi:hypothetical protein